ncbi:NADase-type glycan-binding domain-containing protein [Streptomyces sp. NPDC087440]|uniref:zinc ribbon domain-containing protein n=1 Tax=Streptomyces sp. NPDC087440 TaxID=3365790 RepID=UPI0037F65A09
MTAQNCPECGTRTEPGQSFCDACGAVLGWNRPGSPAASGAAAAPAAPAAPEAERGTPWNAFDRPGSGGTGLASARRTGPTPGDGGQGYATDSEQGYAADLAHSRPADVPRPEWDVPAPVARDARPAGADDDTFPQDPVPARGPATGAPSMNSRPGAADHAGLRDAPDPSPRRSPGPRDAPGPDAAAERARSLLVPVAEPEAPRGAPPVAPVLPGRPDAERPHVRTPEPRRDTGDGPPCRWCTTPNRPGRHFCCRCAMPLAEEADEQATPRLPWWRRLLGRRRQDTPWAGDRPPLRRALDRVGTWIGIAVALALVVLAAVFLPDGIRATSDHFAKRAPVSPDTVLASHTFPGHKPELVFDKRSNTWWGSGRAESGQGEWIEVGFREPTRLLDVIITPGVSSRPEKIGESALPHRVKATITGKDGTTTTRDLVLDQGAGAQRRPFRVGEVTKVRFTVESAHAASATKQVALAEIEFFGPSSAGRF